MRRPWVGLILGLGAAAGCGEGELATGAAPELLEARFLDACLLELTFSEPMAPVDGIEADIFRLSAAFYADGVTTYYDLGIHLDGSEDDGENPPKDLPLPSLAPAEAGAVDTFFGPPDQARHYVARFFEIERDETSPEVLRLLHNLEVDARGVCEAIEAADDARLMLHYSTFWSPRITDTGGEPLADLGSHWVRSVGMKVEQGRYPFMPNDLPIPCPPPGAAHGSFP